MIKYKNVALIFVSVILFVYAGFISIFPSAYTKNFNIDAFQEKASKTTGLDVTLGSIDVKIKPNFTTIIKLKNLTAEYPDKQHVFTAKTIEFDTTPLSLFSSKYKIGSLSMKYVKYDDMILPSQENKLAYLKDSFNPIAFGKKNITITPGPIHVDHLDVSYTVSEPYSYKTESFREMNFSEEQVKDFLSSMNFTNIKVK